MDAESDWPSEEDIRRWVRERLADGRLPRVDGKVVASPRGSGRACAVCDRPITRSDPEYQPQSTTFDENAHVAHRACYVVWLHESGLMSPPERPA